MAHIRWILPFAAALVAQFGVGQVTPLIEPQKRQVVRIEQISTEQGLSQGLISGVQEDSHGFLWIGTMDGLNRYDGREFRIFRHDPDNPHSISGNHIINVCVDSGDRIWIITRANDIDMYDPSVGRFYHVPRSVTGSNTLRLAEYHRLILCPDGDIIATNMVDAEVISIQPTTLAQQGISFTVQPIKTKYPGLNSLSGALPFQTRDSIMPFVNMGFTKDGTLWLIDNDFNILSFPPAALRGDSSHVIFETNEPKMTEEELKQYSYRPNRLLFNAEKTEVYSYNGKRSFARYDREASAFIPIFVLPESCIPGRHVLIDHLQRIWITQNSDPSFLRYDLQTKKLERIAVSEAWKQNTDYRLFLDSRYNIWVLTSGMGLGKINSRNEIFRQIPESECSGDGMWFYRTETPHHPRHEFNQTALSTWLSHRQHFRQSDIYPHLVAYKSPMVIDEEGYHWFSCYYENEIKDHHLHRIARYHPITKDLKYAYFHQHPETFAHYGTPLFFDSHGDILFCDNVRYGSTILKHLNRKTGEVKEYPFPITQGEITAEFITDYLVENDNQLWLSTLSGLFHLSLQTGESKAYQQQPDKPHTRYLNQILSILQDPVHPEKYLWLGTSGGGLQRFDRSTGDIIQYTMKDGLPNDVVYGVLPDDHNNLWLSTNLGLCHFDPRGSVIRNYTSKDGINGNEFNSRQFAKAADGTMYFGGVNGITYFHPEVFYKTVKPSEVVFTGLQLRSGPIEFNLSAEQPGNDFQLNAPIEYTKELVFDYDERIFKLTFALLDLTVPSQNKYQCKLVGFDPDWMDRGKDGNVTYTNLSPGKYELLVRGCNSANIWSDPPAKLIIIIRSPWWGTWWFRSLIILAVISGFYGFYRYRINQMRSVQRMRDRIARDLHDDIGSALSSLSLYSAVLSKTVENDTLKAKAISEKIISNSSELLERMNDLIWTVKSDHDTFEQVINRMRAFAVGMTEARGITLVFTADSQVNAFQFDMLFRKNIFLIFKEAVNNAVKYSACSQLKVLISASGPRQVKIEVRDNGKGFDTAASLQSRDLLKGGNGIESMKFRAKEIGAEFSLNSAPGTGTSLILIVDVPSK